MSDFEYMKCTLIVIWSQYEINCVLLSLQPLKSDVHQAVFGPARPNHQGKANQTNQSKLTRREFRRVEYVLSCLLFDFSR